jgi:hypothetical protein
MRDKDLDLPKNGFEKSEAFAIMFLRMAVSMLGSIPTALTSLAAQSCSSPLALCLIDIKNQKFVWRT